MPTVIKSVRLEGFSMSTDNVGGQYLKSLDVDAHDGWGEAVFTDDISEAMKLKDIGEAFEVWKRQSTVRPLRLDGQPNRPLSAFTVTFEEVP